ncbi:efflux RND transporter periplasmic adaptor subunit [Dyella sp.]|uniref:efflux RND transporter periplasmic adaptor subunit n=1 Tax=Dyella sp. TaxID=1869338 RepID=UPI002FDA51F6
MKRIGIVIGALAGAAVLLALGYVGGRHVGSASMPASTTAGLQGTQRKVLYWYDTMVPDQHFDHPGVSPMGMQMVPKYADDGSTDKSVVRIDPATVQNLGVRTVPVVRRVLAAQLEVPGTVSWNLRDAVTVSARVDATVERLDVRAPYTAVKAGQPLAELLAPQWSSAIAEYRALQHAQSPDAQALRAAARQRLQVLGLTAQDIASERGGHITLHAPKGGVVTTLDVREGQQVGAGQTLMTLNGLSTVWVEAALPQAAAGTVRTGTPVTVRATALPGQVFRGQVEALLPDLDPMTRTQRARIVLPNPDHALSPGQFVTVELQPPPARPELVVPDGAVIATGSDTPRVIVAEGNGQFRPVAVRLGRSAGGDTEILAGLSSDERVVVSGQFLIDSEASLSGALQRLQSSEPAHTASSAMPGMPMPEQRP